MKKNVLRLTLSFLLILSWSAKAQFNKAIGIDKSQRGHSVQSTVIDPGYVVAGREEWDGITLGKFDGSIVKTKPDGSPSWIQLYGGENYDWFNSIREVPIKSVAKLDPGFAALGMSMSFTGTQDIYFVRTDQSGSPLFSVMLGGEKNDEGHCLQLIKDYETGQFGYVLVGQSNSYPFYGGTNDIFVAKLDETGTLVKATVLGGGGSDIGYWIEQTNDGGFIIAGSTTSATCAGGPQDQNQDIIAIKLDPKLNIVWNTIIGHEENINHDVAYGVVEDPTDGSFTFTGYTTTLEVAGRGDAFLLNLSAMGGFNWMKSYGTEMLEIGQSIMLNREKCGEVEYVVAGVSHIRSPKGDACVFKTDRLGNLLWTRLYGTEEGGEAAAEITDSNDNGYIFTGYASANFTNLLDFYLVKTDINGKSGSCEVELDQRVKEQFPCVTSSLQQVFVDDIKRVDTRVKRVEYRENKCSSYATVGATVPDENTLEEIVVTPNPATNSISLRATSKNIKGGTLKVYNREGVIVFEGSVSDDSLNLAISGFPKNMYVIHIVTPAGENVYGKFLKE